MKKSFPLLQSQLGVFLECQEEPTLRQYNLAAKITLGRNVDLLVLRQAICNIIDARPILRTRFFIDGEGNPRQYEDPQMNIDVAMKSMGEDELGAYINDELTRPFQLVGSEPLCRFEIVETETGRYLLYCIHHTICDGTTFFTLFTKFDLERAYNGAPLDKEVKTLADFALEEERLASSAAAAETVGYYKAKFAEAEATELSSATGSRLGNAISYSDKIDSDSINAWCAARRLRPNNLLQAAFSLVLSRFSRRQKVVYASVRHGRDDKALLHSYGMFVRTVPVLVDTNPDMKVDDYVVAVAAEWKSTHRMADYSFMQFCHDTHIQPTITFTYQGEKMVKDYSLAGEKVDFKKYRCGSSARDLTCYVYSNAGYYEIQVEANDSLYDETYLQRFAKAMKVCVGELMRHTDGRLGDVEIVSAEDMAELAALGKGETLGYDRSETLVDLFERQAKNTPDAIAVVYKDRQYSYRQIDGMTDRLAAHLRNVYKVGRETVVGVMIDRSEWMVLYPLAVMKAGGVYMPLDSHFPEDRLAYMTADAGVKLILSENGLVKTSMPSFAGETVYTDGALGIMRQDTVADLCMKTAREDRPRSDNAYVILYTSGSTGRPKGCVLEHHSIVNFCHWYAKEFNLSSVDRGVAYANFGFDAHMMDIYPLLSVGGTVFVLPSDIRMDLTAIHRYMEDNAVTIAFFTTQIGVQMASLFEYRHLRLLSVGGEKLVPIKTPAFKFYNAYGPTECTIFSTVYEQRHDYEDAPIGRPIAGYQLYVMDQAMHLVPQGVAGELCVAGDGVGREYLNNPEMTAAKFVTVGGVRMLHIMM